MAIGVGPGLGGYRGGARAWWLGVGPGLGG